MPALRAAAGSFQVKSPTTYLITVLMTVRALPFVLTVVLIFSVILFVSILGARLYSDQRYSSMQISATRHSSGISIGRATGFGSSFPSLSVDRDTSRPRASGCGVGRDSGKGASRADVSAAEKPERTGEFSGGSGSARAVVPSVTRAASWPPLALFSMPDEPMTPSLAALHPVSAIMPHNNATKETRFRGVIGPSPALPRKARRTVEIQIASFFGLSPASCRWRVPRIIIFPKRVAQTPRGFRGFHWQENLLSFFCALCQASWQLADVPPAHSDVGLCG